MSLLLRIVVRISKISADLAEMNGRKIFSLSALNNSIYFPHDRGCPLWTTRFFIEITLVELEFTE